MTAVSEEYEREVRLRVDSAEQRRAERVVRLLDGEPIDISELPYDFDGWHLALVATGPSASQALRDFGASLSGRLLLVRADSQTEWCWLGSKVPLDRAEIDTHLSSAKHAELALGVGEPGRGLAGWRFTHRQAKAALLVAQRGHEQCVRHGDVALLAASLQDDVLAGTLRQKYLWPLRQNRDGGEVARLTASAYLEAGGNVSSAAAALGVSRQTVKARLLRIEERIGCSIEACTGELRTALSLHQLTSDRIDGPL